MVITVALLIMLGFKYWNQHQYKVVTEASKAYEQMMLGISTREDQKIISYANQIVSSFPNTVYADAALLTLAKLDVVKGKYDLAKDKFTRLIAQSKQPVFIELSKIRMVRLLIAEQQFEKASELLKDLNQSIFSPLAKELSGDVFTGLGKKDSAILSYQAALKELKSLQINHFFLEMKLNQLLNSQKK